MFAGVPIIWRLKNAITATTLFLKKNTMSQQKHFRKLLQARQKNIKDNTSALDGYVYKHIVEFCGRDFDIEDVDARFIKRFADYLVEDKGVAVTTAKMYLHKLHAFLGEAMEYGYIKDIPYVNIKRILPKAQSKEKEYLTVQELKRLSDTPCGNEVLKNAFLFSCYTGLRLSDIETLTWSDIVDKHNTSVVEKKQQKTDKMVRVPLCDEALEVLDTMLLDDLYDAETYRVFPLPSRTAIGLCLNNWIKRAKIDKHISFHSARVTFATMSLQAGVDIAVVSRLCGHSNISTTMIYAKMTDTTYLNSVNKLNEILK